MLDWLGVFGLLGSGGWIGVSRLRWCVASLGATPNTPTPPTPAKPRGSVGGSHSRTLNTLPTLK